MEQPDKESQNITIEVMDDTSSDKNEEIKVQTKPKYTRQQVIAAFMQLKRKNNNLKSIRESNLEAVKKGKALRKELDEIKTKGILEKKQKLQAAKNKTLTLNGDSTKISNHHALVENLLNERQNDVLNYVSPYCLDRLDTIGASLRNANLQLRAEPQIPLGAIYKINEKVEVNVNNSWRVGTVTGYENENTFLDYLAYNVVLDSGFEMTDVKPFFLRKHKPQVKTPEDNNFFIKPKLPVNTTGNQHNSDNNNNNGENVVNMTAVLTKVLSEVFENKISDVQTLLGKIQMEFESKKQFVNKRELIFLNFENDCFRPVFAPSCNIAPLLQWYEDCDLILEIEEPKLFFPETITENELQNFIYKDINCKYKKEYLESYLPQALNLALCSESVKQMHKRMFDGDSKNVSFPEVKKCLGLAELGIEIADNLKIWTKKEIKPKKEILNPQHIFGHGFFVKNGLNVSNMFFDELKNQTGQDPFANLSLDEPKHEVVPYNAQDVNWLDPLFASTALSIEVPLNEEVEEAVAELTTLKESVIVIFNEMFLQTLVLMNPTEEQETFLEKHPEFGFQKLFAFQTHNKKIVDYLQELFHKCNFNSIEEINTTLQRVSQFIEVTAEQNNTLGEEEKTVKSFLNSNFTFDTDLNHKMKASTLFDIIVASKECNIKEKNASGFKNRLSRYLKEVGLQKKRYNDGFYYYGIVKNEVKQLERISMFNILNNTYPTLHSNAYVGYSFL